MSERDIIERIDERISDFRAAHPDLTDEEYAERENLMRAAKAEIERLRVDDRTWADHVKRIEEACKCDDLRTRLAQAEREQVATMAAAVDIFGPMPTDSEREGIKHKIFKRGYDLLAENTRLRAAMKHVEDGNELYRRSGQPWIAVDAIKRALSSTNTPSAPEEETSG